MSATIKPFSSEWLLVDESKNSVDCRKSPDKPAQKRKINRIWSVPLHITLPPIHSLVHVAQYPEVDLEQRHFEGSTETGPLACSSDLIMIHSGFMVQWTSSSCFIL